VNRSRLRPRFGAILATALFTIALVPGLASAADTRLLSITMSPPSRVSIPAEGTGPYATMFQVRIMNDGGQNLAHTALTINANATNNTELALVTIYDPTPGGTDASPTFCSTSDEVITCSYPGLGAGLERTVAVVVSVTHDYVAAVPAAALFTASVTTNNENGSNTQTFGASSGGFAVEATGDNTVATFALENVPEDLSTTGVGGDAGNLSTNVKFTSGNKELVQINEGSSTSGFYVCPTGVSQACQTEYSEVTTSSGFFSAAPFFTWKLTAVVPKTYSLSQGFVAHYPVGATTFVFNDPNNDYWMLLFKNKSALCGTNVAAKIASAHQCILGAPTLTKYDKTHNLLVVTVVMDHQGGMKY
jgi:hypothetical protein